VPDEARTLIASSMLKVSSPSKNHKTINNFDRDLKSDGKFMTNDVLENFIQKETGNEFLLKNKNNNGLVLMKNHFGDTGSKESENGYINVVKEIEEISS